MKLESRIRTLYRCGSLCGYSLCTAQQEDHKARNEMTKHQGTPLPLFPDGAEPGNLSKRILAMLVYRAVGELFSWIFGKSRNGPGYQLRPCRARSIASLQ